MDDMGQSIARTQDDRLWAAGVHVGALLAAWLTSWSAGVAGALVALAVWFLARDRHPFAADHAKEALNFNITMFLGMCLVGVLALVLVGATILTLGIGAIVTVPAGIVLLLVVGAMLVAWTIFGILAAMAAWEGKPYRYPLNIRLVK